jgi:hypothetical protein
MVIRSSGRARTVNNGVWTDAEALPLVEAMDSEPGPFGVQAAIAALHCTGGMPRKLIGARLFASTMF